MTAHKQRRPANSELPEPISDTPEYSARAILTIPPKPDDEWRYLTETDDY